MRDNYNISPESERRRRQAISDAARRLKAGEGYIYVASWLPGEIKIGCALDLANRMKTLKIDTCNAVEPKLLACMRGSILLEKKIHRTLRRYLRRDGRGHRSEVYPVGVLLHPVIPVELRVAA